jgi:hypothetical protein
MHCCHQAALSAIVFLMAGTDYVEPSQAGPERAIEADHQITRLPPSAFPELPIKINQELERRGCTIPQVPSDKKPHNVISGEFTGKGRTDWAVLCSLNRVSTILIFRNASEREPLEIAPQADADSLQRGGGTAIEYSRAIEPVGREYILKHYRAYGGPAPAAIDHQGINDSFVGKASVVRYFYAGKWLELTGAD